MKRTFHILLITFLLVACSDRGTKQDTTNIDSNKTTLEIPEMIPADSLFNFYTNCKISSDKIKEREQGDKIVFHYIYKNTDYANTSDEEYYEEIQFEIKPETGREKYFTNNPAFFNTTFNWGCFCDWPDSLEALQNEGEIELQQLNDTVWNVKLHIRNKPLNKSMNINKNFKFYKPRYELASRDTINKSDRFNRKQGHWIIENDFSIKNGQFSDNRFSGSIFNFMHYKDRKTLSSIWIFENDKWTESLKFNEFGKRIK